MNITIIGAGDIGYHLAGMLASEKKNVVLVDQNEEALNRIGNEFDLLTVCGSATSPRVLDKAGVRNADLIIAATNIDEVNILAAMMSKRMGAKKTIARVRNEDYSADNAIISPQELGIDVIIQPELSTAQEIVQLLKRAEASDLIDLAEGKIQVVGLRVDRKNPFTRKSLDEMSAEISFTFRIVALLRGGRTIVPKGKDKIIVNDTVFAVMLTQDVPKLLKAFAIKNAEINHVMIAGGSLVGEHLLRLMQRDHPNWSVKLIESDADRAYKLASEFEDALILNGEPANVDLLVSEGISDADVFISISEDEESNIINCLVAKHLGVKKTVASVSRPSFLPLSQTIGLDAAVNKKLSAASEIHRHVLDAKIFSVSGLHGISAELVEIEAGAECKVKGRRIEQLRLPDGCVVGGLIRAETHEAVIPAGDTIIRQGDHIFLFAVPQSLEKAVSVFV